jgi:hypothetical protein
MLAEQLLRDARHAPANVIGECSHSHAVVSGGAALVVKRFQQRVCEYTVASVALVGGLTRCRDQVLPSCVLSWPMAV